MRTFAEPARGHCASCDGTITATPVYRMDETYCCLGCADRGPCICLYEQDLSDDGVDHLGMPFPVEAPEAAPASPARVGAPVSGRR